MKRGARRIRALVILVALGTAIFFALRIFVGDVFDVRTPSMEPTIDGTLGESLFVRYCDPEDLERFDLVVFSEPDFGDLMVKRVIGLPGETIQIVAGDVHVDGRDLEPCERWPILVPVFDDRVLAVEDFFHFKSEPAWQRDGAAWALDALDVIPGSRAGMMAFHKGVGSGYMRRSGERVLDRGYGNDIAVSARVASIEGKGYVVIEVLEDGDTFQARLRVDGTTVRAGLHRLPIEPGSDPAPIAKGSVERAAGASLDLELRNIDDRVSLTIDGEVVFEHHYESNRPYLSQLPAAPRSIGARASIGGCGVRARFSAIRVARDLVYLSDELFGEFATSTRLQLGPNEYFVLGDNTADSIDGRRFGPLEGARVVGRASAVVWPPARMRLLR